MKTLIIMLAVLFSNLMLADDNQPQQQDAAPADQAQPDQAQAMNQPQADQQMQQPMPQAQPVAAGCPIAAQPERVDNILLPSETVVMPTQITNLSRQILHKFLINYYKKIYKYYPKHTHMTNIHINDILKRYHTKIIHQDILSSSECDTAQYTERAEVVPTIEEVRPPCTSPTVRTCCAQPVPVTDCGCPGVAY